MQGAAWRLSVTWRALIRGLVLCLVLAGWLAPGYALPVVAAGTTRYVAPTGSDSGDCSASTAPCKTIAYAISQAQAGDTISIGAGTYAEHLDIEKNLTLVGAGASNTAIDGSNTGTVVAIGIANTATVVTLSSLTVQHGNAASNGGGIVNAGSLTLASSTVSGNSTSGTSISGGGISNSGTLTLTNSMVSGNSTPNGHGAGISNDSSGTAMLANSTVSGNSASYAGGGIFNSGTLTLTNSTISGNSVSSSDGGGIRNGGVSPGTLTLTNSTISGNSAPNGGGGGISNSSGLVTLTNSILAGNTAPTGPDCYNTSASLTSGGYNLLGIGDGGCSGLANDVNGDRVGTGSSPLVPLLDPLGDYGGPTLTMAPQPGSPALDAVPASHCTLTSDQRGQPRPDEAADGGACDIGAVEGTGPAPTISLSASSLDFGTESVDFFSVTQTVRLTNSGVVPLFLSSTGITITGTNPEDFLETNSCAGTTIAPGTSCTIDINFWPGAAGTRSAVLSITDNAADSPQRVALSGVGQFAVAAISPLALDFGNQVVGTTSAVKSVTVQNNSQADLGIFAIFGTGFGTTGAFTATTSDCFVDAIAPGDSCTLNVRFRPQATGSSTGTLFIYDNAADSPQMVSLSGAGTLPATNTPVPPGATPTHAPVPPTSPPTTQPTATPTRTPAPSAARMLPTATPVVCTSRPALPPLSVDIAPHRALVAGSNRALALSRTLRYVTGGGTLPLAIRTAPHATVTASLDVVATQVVIRGTGTHRTRTTRRVVLYHTSLHGNADATGRYSPQMHVAYQPNRPVVATLTVQARTTCGTAMQRTNLTILPLRITVTPRRLVGGGPLTVMLHTGAKGQVSITLEVDTTRDTVMGQGTQRHHVRQVVALYRLRLTGTADAHGRFSRRVAIAYQPSKPMPASITVTVRLPQGTATGRATATLLPRRHH